jgi:hypothetical protein
MSQVYTASRFQEGMTGSMEAATEMVAAAMMLVSISERDTVNVGYKSCYSLSSSCKSSGSNLNGWGTDKTRKSYKVNLCSLDVASDSESVSQHQYQPCGVDQVNEDWGFFDGTFSS